MLETAVPLGLTCGDPAGVGPEICLRAAAACCEADSLAIFGDPSYLLSLAARLGLAEHFITGGLREARPGRVVLVATGVWSLEALRPGPTAEGGRAQFDCIERAISDALQGRLRGLVTGPMSKAAVNLAGEAFVGHTEHLAQRAGLDDDEVTMMFLGPRLRLALVTTHISIRNAPQAITAPRVERSAVHLGQALVRLDGPRFLRGRRLLVAGLNPHAGEGGLFGDEEMHAITPGMERAAQRSPLSDQLSLEGPVPAETAIRLAAEGKVAGVVTMIHDQATIPSKALDWGAAVNVTWGLPFVRTSVDHGVGYDAVAAKTVDATGMVAALQMAQLLTTPNAR